MLHPGKQHTQVPTTTALVRTGYRLAITLRGDPANPAAEPAHPVAATPQASISGAHDRPAIHWSTGSSALPGWSQPASDSSAPQTAPARPESAGSASAATIYEKDGFTYKLNGDLQVQLRQDVGADKNAYVDFDDLELDINQAIPIGLIINELISNSVKHGFKDGKKAGTIRVLLSLKGQQVELKVQDNGEGLPRDFDLEKNRSLGMTLIDRLTAQIDGRWEIKNNDWTTAEVIFPVPDLKTADSH